jgi:hypothetical protein
VGRAYFKNMRSFMVHFLEDEIHNKSSRFIISSEGGAVTAWLLLAGRPGEINSLQLSEP